MNFSKSNNVTSEQKSKLNTKSRNIKSIDSFDNPMKIYEYQNRIHMIQIKINKKVKEEQKNIEKNLTKLKTSFHNLTSRNFYKNYQKFTEKYFKTTDLVENIAEKYHEKGYIIPKLNLDFSKVNPLLDSNVNKLFISYLFDRKDGEKINYEKLYKKNKGIKYMKKLEYFISPEKSEEKEKEKEKEKKSKSKKHKKKQKKFRLSKNKIRRSDTGLINLRNMRNYNINTETTNKKNNSSRSIQKYFYKGINKTTNSLFNNKNDKNKINSSKSINNRSLTPSIKSERKNNKYDSHKINLKKKSGLHLNLSTDKSKAIYSSNNLALLNAFSLTNNIKTSSNTNHIYLNSENKSTEKKDENSLDTPRSKTKDKINTSTQNKTSNTKPFSTNNTELNLSANNKIQSSKTKNLLSSFKTKEFSVNSKKEKNSNESKKIVINDYNSKNIIYPKLSRYSYKYKNNPIESTKIDNISKDNRKTFTNPKNINSSVKKENAINRIYKQLKAGKYENIEKKMRNYLSKSKKMDENEVDCMIKKYQYKNVKSNFNELKKYINEKKISKKIERIYLNNHDYNRIEPLMNLLNTKEKEIFMFDNKISKIYNKS